MWSREVLCPWCGKKSIWESSSEHGRLILYKENERPIGQRIHCPKCKEEFAMLNDRLAGIFVDDVAISGFETMY